VWGAWSGRGGDGAGAPRVDGSLLGIQYQAEAPLVTCHFPHDGCGRWWLLARCIRGAQLADPGRDGGLTAGAGQIRTEVAAARRAAVGCTASSTCCRTLTKARPIQVLPYRHKTLAAVRWPVAIVAQPVPVHPGTGVSPTCATVVPPPTRVLPLGSLESTLAVPPLPQTGGRCGPTSGPTSAVGVARRLRSSAFVADALGPLGRRCWRCGDAPTGQAVTTDPLVPFPLPSAGLRHSRALPRDPPTSRASPAPPPCFFLFGLNSEAAPPPFGGGGGQLARPTPPN